MADRPYIGLDNPAFEGRLKRIDDSSLVRRRPKIRQAERPSAKYFNNNLVTSATVLQAEATSAKSQPIATPIATAPVSIPAAPQLNTQTSQQNSTSILPFEKLVSLEPAGKLKKPKSTSTAQKAVLAMAVIVFIVGVFVSALTLKINISARDKVAAIASQTDPDKAPPDETHPGDISGYKVAPDLPKFIKVSSLKINARVKPVGVTKDNALQAPRNIFDAGWYSASAKPGDAGSNGAMLIDGHVHGPTLPGVFAMIKTMKPGDTITIQRGDDKIFNYSVVKVQSYDAKTLDMGIGLTSVQPGMPGLNLITCSGKLDKATNEYEKRTIVFAVQQS